MDILVRASHDRNLPNGQKLFTVLKKRRPAGTIDIFVARLSRRSNFGRIRDQGRQGRLASMDIRFASVTLDGRSR